MAPLGDTCEHFGGRYVYVCRARSQTAVSLNRGFWSCLGHRYAYLLVFFCSRTIADA